ncbi:hypothetical protein [Desulfurispora thermophila]|uniref:hypothetical protein n=1 Tax=Desulfurispora thermophila TaxID=265470 RepID=UPI0003669AEB|nr:hypothetical protein [Desulfurispora thermophila]
MSVNNSTMQIDASKANVLVPTQYLQQVSPWHVARTSIVTVNPDPNYGDVYKVGSRWNEQKKAAEDIFALGKPALMRIAAAAGIVWNWRESGPQVIQKDYVVYKAVGALRLPDGSWQPIVATKEIDLTVIEEETYEANLKKALEYASDPKKQAALKGMTPEQWAQAQTKAAMIQWRKNKLMRAETGAMLRVIRAALGMKSQYTREELEKPFIVPRIDFSPDYSDPEVRKALIENGIQAMATLFGQSAPTSPALGPGSGSSPFSGSHPALTGPDIDDDTPYAVEDAAFIENEASQSQEEEQPSAQEQPQQEEQTAQGQMGLFPGAPAPSPPTAAKATAKNGKAVAYCEVCGNGITEKVLQYSQQKYGRALCYKCQSNGGAKA